MAGQWKDAFAEVKVAAGVAGYLDWATGLMRLNASHNDWKRISAIADLSKLQRWEQDLVQTMTHETIHFLQITTTSYLFVFAVELFNLIRRAIPDSQRDASGVAQRASPEFEAKIRAQNAALDKVGPRRVTVRSLAEGQAMLAQLRTHWCNLTPDSFLNRLFESTLPSEYWRAYTVAHDLLGDNAFEIFPSLSSIALCTKAPAEAFVTMCEALVGKDVPHAPSEIMHECLVLANDLHKRGQIQLVGTSAEVVESVGWHPLYSPMVATLNDLSADFSMLDCMAAPHKIAPAIAAAVARPVMFNPDASGDAYIHIPDNWRPDLVGSARRDEIETLVLLMIVAARLSRGRTVG